MIGPEDVLRAVAVMHVEIDDRGALDAVALLRMARGDGGVVEQAEAHRPRGLGMMAGRAHGDEGVARPCLLITSSTAMTAPPAARSAASKLPGDIVVSASSRTRPCFRRGVADRGDVVHRMAERDGLERGRRRLDARET